MTTSNRSNYDKQLNELQDELMLLGNMVEKAIAKAVEALRTRDLISSEQVIAEDDRIDRERFEIEERCINLIAQQQPLAGDLRHIIAILHIAVEL